jgi:hypothetical protein
MLEFFDATLEIFFATLGLVERSAQASLGVAGDHLRSARTCVALLEFCDATAEQLIDQVEFTDARLERGVEGQETLVCLGGFAELAING